MVRLLQYQILPTATVTSVVALYWNVDSFIFIRIAEAFLPATHLWIISAASAPIGLEFFFLPSF